MLKFSCLTKLINSDIYLELDALEKISKKKTFASSDISCWNTRLPTFINDYKFVATCSVAVILKFKKCFINCQRSLLKVYLKLF